MDDHRHPEAYKEWITSITDTFRSIPGIGLYMSRQLARSCCLRFAPANLDLETLKSLDPDQGGHLAAEVGDHRKHPLDVFRLCTISKSHFLFFYLQKKQEFYF